MTENEYTLEDLEQATGFSKRQIRFYITKKLVPGAGDSRGPNAVYSDETLTKLRAIAHLKDMDVPPTGRKMTLEEIGHALATLSDFELAAMVDGHAILKAVDTESDIHARKMMRESILAESEEPSTAASYLASIRPNLSPSVSHQRRILQEPLQVGSPRPDPVEPTLFPSDDADTPDQEIGRAHV